MAVYRDLKKNNQKPARMAEIKGKNFYVGAGSTEHRNYSIGANIKRKDKNVGGTVGISRGKPYGSVNVNGKIIAQYGLPEEEGGKKKKSKKSW